MTDRALLIGIDEYPDPVNNLNSCVADTREFGDLLGRFGFAESGIRVLHNSDGTLAAAREGLDWLFYEAQEGDRRVFFQSSHGYRYLKGDVMTEVLCTYDDFLEDTELADRSSGLPPGVLTVVIDSCHSGGMDKSFFVKGVPLSVRTKVFTPPREQLLRKSMTVAAARGLKPFGCTTVRDEASMVQKMAHAPKKVPPAKGSVAGNVELNGVLITACRADQTAAAGSDTTDWLSAFTYALLAEMDESISVAALRDRTVERIEGLNMSQTPCAFAPSDQQHLLADRLIPGERTKSRAGITGKGFAADMGAGGRKVHRTEEEKEMSTTETEKAVSKATKAILTDISGSIGGQGGYGGGWYTDAQLCGAVLAPAVAAALPAPQPGKSFAVQQPLSDSTRLLDKDFWSSALNVARVVVPAVLDEFTESGGPAKGAARAPDPAELQRRIAEKVPAKRMGNEKFFGLVETLIGVAAPLIINAVTKDFQLDGGPSQGKIEVDLPEGLSEAEKKGWFDDALDVVGDVLPYVVQAVLQRAGAEPDNWAVAVAHTVTALPALRCVRTPTADRPTTSRAGAPGR